MATQKQLAAAREEFNARKAAKAAETRAKNKAAKLKEEKKAARAAQKAAAQHVEAAQPDVLHANIEDLIGNMPSAGRVVVGFILALTASVMVGYGIGMLMVYALAGIATLTGAAWLAFTLSVLVWVIGLYSSWKLGGWVGGKVFSSVVLPEGLASRSYEAVKNGVKSTKDNVVGWFSERPSIAQYSGAFTKPVTA